MAPPLEHVQIPSYATMLHSQVSSSPSRHVPKVASTPPKSESVTAITPSIRQQPQSPKSTFNISSAILASGITMPNASPPKNPRKTSNLTSSMVPLSLPTTTANFRRFAAKCGPVFWFQDRVEEVVLWRKGWKVTTAWMCAYAFICMYLLRLLCLHV